MTDFDRGLQFANHLGLPPEEGMSAQAMPREGHYTYWTGEDCCAIIFGLDRYVVDFIFDANGKFDRVRVGFRMLSHVAECEAELARRIEDTGRLRFKGCDDRDIKRVMALSPREFELLGIPMWSEGKHCHCKDGGHIEDHACLRCGGYGF